MITIVLLSHNNSQYLRRALSYYKQLKFKGEIFIADSSSSEEKNQISMMVKEFKDDQFSLTLFQNEGMTFGEKVANAIQKVCTPYVLLAPVDDFFSIQSLYEAEVFLTKNLSYSFVRGYAYGYMYQQGMSIEWYYVGDCYNPRLFNQENPLERIDSYLNSYTSTMYSLFRTIVFRDIFEQVIQYANDECGKFFENMITILAFLYGKGLHLKVPFSWRELNDSSAGRLYHQKWLIDEHFEKNKQFMEDGVKSALERILQFDSKKSDLQSKLIVQSFISYNFQVIFPAKKKGFKSFILRHAPMVILSGLRIMRNIAVSLRRDRWSGEHLLRDVRSSYYWSLSW